MTLPRFSVRKLLAVIAVCSMPFAVIMWHVNSEGEWSRAARRSQCRGNLLQIATALHNYHEAYGSFPPAYIAAADGKPMHSWRVLILPFLDLEEKTLYNAYNFAQPWDGPANRHLMNRAPWTFSCPSVPRNGSPGPYTSYVALVGEGTVFPGTRPTCLSEIRDGTSRTILLVETADAKIPWTSPFDLDASSIPLTINGDVHPGILSADGPGAHVVFADGGRSWVKPGV